MDTYAAATGVSTIADLAYIFDSAEAAEAVNLKPQWELANKAGVQGADSAALRVLLAPPPAPPRADLAVHAR